MNRIEFMKELEYLLSDLPDEEKLDALDYYRDYLEEAGEAESEVIRELGSPERIAAIIRADIRGDLKEGGAFTERGFEDERFRQPGYQMVKRMDLPEEGDMTTDNDRDRETQENVTGSGKGYQAGNAGTAHGKRSGWKIAGLVLLVLAAAPVLLAVGGSLMGAGIGVLTAVIAAVGVCLLLMAVLTLALVIGGFALLVFGAVQLCSRFPTGLFYVGTALVMLAFGILGVVVSVWFYGKIIPAIFRGGINVVNRLIHRRVRRA